ncbi:pyrroline-5-carboxylate reductase [Clostridium sp. WLY-B-L2]|uniref:Pyrroline-5-carboxylate reductase n=1 Tax=Clostridium aromativorans TaxID=2836848 RepID=A0ABS8N832_9CLOT|nr:pyrroline-5-carboxylate reductase [Clostridium aromativorans]MCC9294903.1 pyrroline-5-carboxylate reductase [Clostridium aromativorans]
MLNKKIVFIGGGNMSEGIIRGIINNKVLVPGNIYVYDVLDERIEYLHNTYGIVSILNVEESVRKADIIIIAVRPQDFNQVVVLIKGNTSNGQIIISICAGINVAKMANFIGNEHKFARIMPNTMVEAQHGYSGVCVNDKIANEDKEIISTLFNCLGQTMFINEVLFDEFTAFSCAGPAYVLYFIAAMIDAGVQSGFSRKDSTAITIENIIGSAMMVQMTGKHPYQITDTMTSPAGVTITGCHVLSKTGFHGIVMDAVESAVKRTRELG